MATFGEMQFASDDEEDEDYVDNGSDDDSDAENKKKNGKKTGNAEAITLERNARRDVAKFTAEAWKVREHKPNVSPSDVLLSFQKINLAKTIPVTDVPSLCQYIDVAALDKIAILHGMNGTVSDSFLLQTGTTKIEGVDIAELKERARSESNRIDETDLNDALNKATQADAEVTIKRIVKFAGQVVDGSKSVNGNHRMKCAQAFSMFPRIEENVKKSSRKYLNYLKEMSGSGRIGGALSNLDLASDKLRSLQNVSSVTKSAADWRSYKDDSNLDLELRNRRSFLDDSAFLANSDVALAENFINVKKRQKKMASG